MIIPNVMLGGVPIVIHGGAPQCQYQAVDGGVERLRLSGGAAVQMTHWRKTAITISGSGWIGTGMLGLDFDNPLELRCNASLGISTEYSQSLERFAPMPVRGGWRWSAVSGSERTCRPPARW